MSRRRHEHNAAVTLIRVLCFLMRRPAGHSENSCSNNWSGEFISCCNSIRWKTVDNVLDVLPESEAAVPAGKLPSARRNAGETTAIKVPAGGFGGTGPPLRAAGQLVCPMSSDKMQISRTEPEVATRRGPAPSAFVSALTSPVTVLAERIILLESAAAAFYRRSPLEKWRPRGGTTCMVHGARAAGLESTQFGRFGPNRWGHASRPAESRGVWSSSTR